MATVFCNFGFGSGLNKIQEYFPSHSYITRSPLGLLSSDNVRQSPCLTRNTVLPSRSFKRQLQRKQRHKHGLNVFKIRAESSDSNREHETKKDISKATLIWRAIKLPIYSVALVPLTVGAAAAYLQTGIFSAGRYFMLLASSVLIITWLNLSNDVYDYDTGADMNKSESVVNMAGSRTGTFVASYLFLALGFIGLAWASVEAGNMRAMLLLTSAIMCGYIYQCPPFRLSYQGLGEPLCFAAFGPFATTSFYLLQSVPSEMIYLPLTGTILSASLLVGLTTSLILFCSHFHQVEGDMAVGKRSPLVRVGTRTGSRVVKMSVLGLYSLLFVIGLIKALPLTCIVLCSLTLPMGRLVIRFVEENHEDKAKIFMAKYYCVRLHALFGAALACGLVAAKVAGGKYIPMLT